MSFKKAKIGEHELYYGDCLEVMPTLKDKSIDMIFADLPYGVTARNKWDVIIPFDLLWKQYERIIKDNGAMAFTATEPFSSMLIMSNPKLFRYDLIWNKKLPTGFLNARRMPLRSHEQVLMFYKHLPTYNPIMREGKMRSKGGKIYSQSDCYQEIKAPKEKEIYNEYFPISIIEASNANQRAKDHPTQKPTSLIEWLIRTYTNENDLILDNVMGSGTTGEACVNLNRRFVGIEKDKKYFKIAYNRIKELMLDPL